MIFVPIFNTCPNFESLTQDRHIHLKIIKYGLDFDVYVCNSLLDMYAKCGIIESIVKVFNTMPSRNIISCNSMILGHARCGKTNTARS